MLKQQLLLMSKEEALWGHKCKIRWLKDGNINFSFHRSMDTKKRKNTITEILSADGTSSLMEAKIERNFIFFFTNLYTKKPSSRALPNITHWAPISNHQLHRLKVSSMRRNYLPVFELGPNKSRSRWFLC